MYAGDVDTLCHLAACLSLNKKTKKNIYNVRRGRGHSLSPGSVSVAE